MDEFLDWSDADVQKACKIGFGVAGGLVGGAFGGLASSTTAGVAAPLTVPAGMAYGAALGLAAGLLVCPHVSRDKAAAFLSGRALPRHDAAEVLSALGRISGVRDRQQVLLLAAALREVHAGRAAHDHAGALAPETQARRLLASLNA